MLVETNTSLIGDGVVVSTCRVLRGYNRVNELNYLRRVRK